MPNYCTSTVLYDTLSAYQQQTLSFALCSQTPTTYTEAVNYLIADRYTGAIFDSPVVDGTTGYKCIGSTKMVFRATVSATATCIAFWGSQNVLSLVLPLTSPMALTAFNFYNVGTNPFQIYLAYPSAV